VDGVVNAIQIGERLVGYGHPCFIIAEAGVNHNGDIDNARRLIDVASEAGADAVKFQTFTADRLVTRDAAKAEYQLQNGLHESQYDMLKRLELSAAAHRELQLHSADRGLMFLSTPFDEASADFLRQLGIEAFKIASGEITNLSLLGRVAAYGLPMIVSTGMSNLQEVEQAVSTIRDAGNTQLILLHCVSNYPAAPADVNLRAMDTMRDKLGAPVGYSDHTLGSEVSVAAVARGACVIEKHFTLDRDLPGPDHRASLEPGELKAMVRAIRNVEAALGHGLKEPSASEAAIAAVARRSLVAATDIPAGTTLRDEMIVCKRPGTGLSPAQRPLLIGRTTKTFIRSGDLFSPESVY